LARSGPVQKPEGRQLRLGVQSCPCPERRRHDIELTVAEGQRLRIGFHPIEVDSSRLSFSSAGIEALGRDVQGDDLGPGLGRADRDVAAARSDIENTLTASDSSCLHDDWTDLPHLFEGEPVVVAQSPDSSG